MKKTNNGEEFMGTKEIYGKNYKPFIKHYIYQYTW